MDRGRFWDTLSQQLENRGPDYIERCIFRNLPSGTRDSILPASFPPLPIQEVQDSVPLVKAREEDLQNVCEKFCHKFMIVCTLMIGYTDSLNACVCPYRIFYSLLTHL